MTTTKGLQGKFSDIIYESDTAWMRFGYSTRFQARRAVMLHAVNQGWGLEQCRITFLDPANPGSVLWLLGSDDRELRPTEKIKRLEADYRSAAAKARNSPTYRSASEARQQIREAIALLKLYRWNGRTARTDKEVMLYVLRSALRVGCDKVNVSARDAGIGAGVTTKTASRALNRLSKAGWLVKQRATKKTDAIAWKIGWYQVTTYNTVGQVICSSGETPNDAGHETWLHLGKAARAIYYTLADKPMSARAIAERANVGNATAYRWLPRLVTYAMAASTDDGWIRGRATPDDVQVAEGWIEDNSKLQKRRERIAQERWMQASAIAEHWNQAVPEMQEKLYRGYKATFPDAA